jgi:hypothetical protein
VPLPTSDEACVSSTASSPFRIALLSLQFLSTTHVQYKGMLWGRSARDCFLPSATLIWTSFQLVPLSILSVKAIQSIFRPDVQTVLCRPSIGNPRPAESKSSALKISLRFLNPWRWDPIDCPEASVRNYHSAQYRRRAQISVNFCFLFRTKGDNFCVICELRTYMHI